MVVFMEHVAAFLGVSVPVVRFLIFFFSTVPCSWAWRFIPNPTLRHVYAAFTGMALSHLAFGPGANILFSFPVLLAYASMLINRKICGTLTFLGSFVFLISCHVYYMSGDAWKEGGIDSTGALMVLTLKVISVAMNYQDGCLQEEDLRESQKRNRLVHLPSFISYLGYCFCCGTHLAGPYYEMRDYMNWSLGSEKLPSTTKPTILALLKALACMGMYMMLIPRVPFNRFADPTFRNWNLLSRWFYMWLCGFSARWKYYFIWSVSEASMIVSGLGFSGWASSSSSSTSSSPSSSTTSKPKWDRARNVDIAGVELATSAAQLPTSWNIHVSTWLRFYVYERLVKPGKKAGFLQLLATQVVSAVWHGLYAGYILFFVHTAIMISGSRAIYKWQVSVSGKYWPVKSFLTFCNFLYTLLVLNYACIGFLVLSFHETLTAYSSVYFIGTLLPILITALGTFFKPPKRKQQQRKDA